MEAAFSGDSSESDQDETWDDGAHFQEMSKVDFTVSFIASKVNSKYILKFSYRWLVAPEVVQ